jgi:hypothetical protein
MVRRLRFELSLGFAYCALTGRREAEGIKAT